jgi:hypothetical protein
MNIRGRMIDEDKRTRLFQEVAALIDNEYGGIVTKQYLSMLIFAKKRKRTDN